MDLRVLSESGGILSGQLSDKILVGGLTALLQEVVIELLSDYNPVLNRGAGLQTTIELSDPSSPAATKSAITNSIMSAKAHLLSNQQLQRSVDPSSVLSDLRLVSARTVNGIEWNIELELTSASGETVTSSLTL